VAIAAQAVWTSENNIRRWVKMFDQKTSDERLPPDERAALTRLRRENKELRTEKEILKKTSAFFAKDMN
jgi:transposase